MLSTRSRATSKICLKSARPSRNHRIVQTSVKAGGGIDDLLDDENVAMIEQDGNLKDKEEGENNADKENGEDFLKEDKEDSELDLSEAADFVLAENSLAKLPAVTNVKLDVDAASAITYLTESSRLSNGPPSTVLSSECDTHALGLRLNFLARQLEMERAQR